MKTPRTIAAVWLALAAAWPVIAREDPAVTRGRDWWSFRPVERPAVPREDGRNPIDAFLARVQGELGLKPAPEADRETLVRRLTLDLTGLPPVPEEVDAFLADDRPDAYERLVDRLLASPAFGERWGRHWLDAARYADSDGYELDRRRPDAWRYRDWVVAAINSDKPYGRFVSLQLAADEMQRAEPPDRAALGFLRMGPSVDNERTEQTRLDELDDVASTTASVFLGVSVGCTRCHDHKYDPIPIEDYYRFVAVFAPSESADVSLATPAETAQYAREARAIDAEAARVRAVSRSIERETRKRLEQERVAALPDALRTAYTSGDLSGLSANEQAELIDRTEVTGADVTAEIGPLGAAALAEWAARADAIAATRPEPLPTAMGVADRADAEPVRVLVRGELSRPGAIVRPGPPRAIAGEVFDFPSSHPRAALANWLADGSNPLTARVEVDRIWRGHFGRGLVGTPSDLGATGDPPVLPELLDWLAAELIDNGGSRKAIHRLIVTSAAYRRSAVGSHEAREIDPNNDLFSHFQPRRLEAEAIRDLLLRCGGSLDRRIGGPGVFPPIDPAAVRTGNVPRWPLDATDGPGVWRRGLYVFRMRSVPLPLFEAFDLPDGSRACPARESTTVPTQALALLNDPFVLNQASRFARRVAGEAGTDEARRVVHAHRIATGRTPDAAMTDRMLTFLREQTRRQASVLGGEPPEVRALADLCHVLLNSNAALYLD